MSMSAEGSRSRSRRRPTSTTTTQQVAMTMDLGMLGGEMEMVVDDGVIYMRSPVFEGRAARRGSAWTRRRWIRRRPRSSAGSGPGTTDPSAYAGLFAGVFDVRASGEADIDGVPTTRYVGTIDLEKVLEGFSDVVGEDVDAATKEQLEAAVEQFERARDRRRRSRSRSGSMRRACRAASGSRWTSANSSRGPRRRSWR